MISKMSHASIFVLNQDEAYKFYVDKLGFEVREDQKMDNGFRWLTVGTKTQPDLEIALMEIKPGLMLDEQTATKLRDLVSAGKLGWGAFDTDNCQKEYDHLKSKGVEFLSPPQERPYGIEAIFKDSSGNWFSLTQRK
ncbi:MAG: VOC family protein [Bacteroidetes bacterium]|nr:MAG: VOC family protein [Bacteroidota bacterium]